MGNIGADVFRQASGFGMRYIAHDPYMDEASAKEIGVELVSMEELFVSRRYRRCPGLPSRAGRPRSCLPPPPPSSDRLLGHAGSGTASSLALTA